MTTSLVLDRLALYWFACIGLAVGSFLNVVIFRMPRGYLLSLPRRSVCMSCKTQLGSVENVPVLSFLFLRGKCRHCDARIGIRHPIVEILTAVLFLAVYRYFGFHGLSLYYSFFVAALVAVTFIDIDFRIIPDKISIPGMFVGLGGALFIPEVSFYDHFAGFLFGGGVFWALSFVYQRWTGRDGLGFGDVKLLAMIGAFLGLKGALGTLFVSSIFGSIIGIALMVIQKKTLKMSVPFGPFLALGAFVMLFWGDYFLFHF